jgi:hypothetical protein
MPARCNNLRWFIPIFPVVLLSAVLLYRWDQATWKDEPSFKWGWVVFGFLLLYSVGRIGPAMRDFLSLSLNLQGVDYSDESPADLLRRSVLIGGLAAAVEMLLTTLMVACTWKWCRVYSGAVLWIAWLWFMLDVFEAIIVYFRSVDQSICPTSKERS